ncbi:BMC domain-containing protein [Lonepinella koalarum]|uniref:Microcompartment protein CcmL/EutN n=1 Tax=Lonepinella koalarum TaxID=53417 RepID=A0A4R1KPM6_9PAST|nr:BMC domain-containing protein [Lonepinella koalarum]MDH2926662.1 hypothetical protein [Lonepinella koalarum]TCK66986.1 microcompartment protein CcmL/EutN [Lonepinella koalarum]TFJ88945.1 BMC domain-containing protein [Lonepinella koalarum]
MNTQSLGLIEVIGLSNAIEAADAGVKSANVTLLGYELTNGSGLVLVKFIGEISEVQTAVDAAINAVEQKNGKVHAYKTIARLSNGIESLLIQVQPLVKKENKENITTRSINIPIHNITEVVDETSCCSGDSCLDIIERQEVVKPNSVKSKTKKVGK